MPTPCLPMRSGTRHPAAIPVAALFALMLAACSDGDLSREVHLPGAAPDTAVVTKAPQAWRWDNDANGTEDIAWWNADSGALASWRMNGTTLLGANDLGSTVIRPFSIRTRLIGSSCNDTVYRLGTTVYVADVALDPGINQCVDAPGGLYTFTLPGWTLVDAEGRYDGGTRNHLLWRNTAGTVAIWSMGTGGTIAASGFPATAPTEWSIVDGRGDYDGDGRSDILWRNTAGTVAMWRMTAINAIAGTAFFGTAPTATWTLADASGDYDGNGRSDLLWVDAAGAVVIWNLNVAAQTFTAAPVGNVGAGWRVLDGSVDFDGDRRSDIVWQGPSGQVVMWLMNGSAIKSTRTLGSVGAEWRLIARNAR